MNPQPEGAAYWGQRACLLSMPYLRHGCRLLGFGVFGPCRDPKCTSTKVVMPCSTETRPCKTHRASTDFVLAQLGYNLSMALPQIMDATSELPLLLAHLQRRQNHCRRLVSALQSKMGLPGEDTVRTRGLALPRAEGLGNKHL